MPSPEQDEDRLRARMVGWYDPGQLAVTGLQTVLSTLFAQRADYRLIQALHEPAPRPADYTDHDLLWIDYVADTGDGFNSTYAVARALAKDHVRDGDDELPRGRVLIMGGDEVYPTPTAERYQERLVRPYDMALPPGAVTERPDLYAVPGNHDWYDGLGCFMNLFCHGRTIGAWRTPQERSYFALRLAHDTWLLGVDVQLSSDIDNPQIDYFMGLPIERGHRIILCTPEPDWVYGNIYDGKKNLSVLESRLAGEKGANIVLQIAGDLHHYRRHTLVGKGGKAGDVHLVTAGGGGAFLHPTHTNDIDELKVGEKGKLSTYKLQKEYPARDLSRRLGLLNIPFFVYNPWFGLVTGGVYTILSWVMPPWQIGGKGWREAVGGVVWSGIEAVSTQPSSLVWVSAILVGFVAFTDTHKTAYKWAAGLLHGASHLAAALGVATLASFALNQVVLNPVLERLLTSALIFGGGYLIGSLLMGIYLAISVCIFGRHGNEAFSSLKIEGYKNFLRMRLDKDGLSVWALGLDRVPSDGEWQWKESDDGPGRWEPTPGAPSLEPRVLDHFFIPAAVAGTEEKEPRRAKTRRRSKAEAET